ncbi:TetR/AcrR family transcriptional regulator [Streptomyces sp. NA02950]|uniref:TetR/AcrR family transcriptional regulator n=1 Tax=Streptomyces sp. NA02950 TaxID=2742137 RepID=UPI00158FC788|nr:TetR/AcrR family transcriptional regulator [Streptomyces sp. NA02950]QKV95210.1 TetR/AcrR family transcriptional regulator [Streptomyces sp. NA02950]
MEQNESKPGYEGLRARGVQRTRANILTAARQHLIASGYRNLSLEHVATDADVTRVTIYRQFGSKLGLLDAVAEDLAQRAGLVAGMHAAAALDDPVAAFRAMVSETCRFWSTDPDLLRRLISLSAVDPEAHRVISSREKWRFDQVALFVTRLAEADRVRSPFDTHGAGVTVAAAISFTTCDDIATRLQLDHDRLDDLLLSLLDGVVRLDQR